MTTFRNNPVGEIGLVAEPVSGASHPGLYLVDDHEDPVLVTQLTDCGEESFGRGHDTGLTLDGLQEDRGGVGRTVLAVSAVRDQGTQCVDVTVRVVLDPGGHRLERGALVGLAGECQRAHRSTVEAVLCGEDAGASGAPGDLEGGLVGLGTGVREEDLRARGNELLQPGREVEDLRVGEDVRGVAQGRDLLGHGLDDGRVGVAEGVDGDAGEEVDVLPALSVGDPAAGTGDQLDRRGAVGRHDRGLPGALPVVVVRHSGTPSRRRRSSFRYRRRS